MEVCWNTELRPDKLAIEKMRFQDGMQHIS